MPRPLRIGYGRIAQETNALSPLQTTIQDFRQTHWLEGDELAAASSADGYEAKGFLKNAELSGFVKAARAARGVETVPLLSAWAVPSGPLTTDAFNELLDRLCAHLEQAGPIDALFLALHGAMNAIGVPDPDARICQRVKEVFPNLPLAITLDLHATLNPTIVENTDILLGYQTNPHRDHVRRGQRAGHQLIRMVRGESRPTTAWRYLPMVLGGGLNLDFLPPMRGISRWLRRQEKRPEVIGASLFSCHLWNDTPDLGWAAHIVTDGNLRLAEQLADELAELAWEVRHAVPPELPSAEEAIAEIRAAKVARKFGTVCVCDASDVVGAGAPGENTQLIKAFLEQAPELVVHVPIRDPEAVRTLAEAGEGATVSLTLGGRLDPSAPSLDVTGRVGKIAEREGFGKTAVLQVANANLVITSGPALAMAPRFFTEMGLSIWHADAVVVKSFFPFRLFFGLQNRKTLYVRTKGVTDFDAIRQMSFRRDVHPLQTVGDWRAADRERRLGL